MLLKNSIISNLRFLTMKKINFVLDRIYDDVTEVLTKVTNVLNLKRNILNL